VSLAAGSAQWPLGTAQKLAGCRCAPKPPYDSRTHRVGGLATGYPGRRFYQMDKAPDDLIICSKAKCPASLKFLPEES
jgi:hypothetical protein